MPECPIWELKLEHLHRRLQVWFDAQPDRPAAQDKYVERHNGALRRGL